MWPRDKDKIGQWCQGALQQTGDYGKVEQSATGWKRGWFRHWYGQSSLWRQELDPQQRVDRQYTVEAFEMQCYRKVLRIPYTGHVTNEVLQRMGQQRMLLGRVKSRKLKDFGHIALHQSLEHDLMFGGPVPGIRRQGGQRRQWFDDVTDWLEECARLTENRAKFRHLVHVVSCTPSVYGKLDRLPICHPIG